MANTDKAFGFRPIGNLSATGAQKQYGYEIADNQAGTIFQGDLVALASGFITGFFQLHTLLRWACLTVATTSILLQASPRSRTSIQVLSTSLPARSLPM